MKIKRLDVFDNVSEREISSCRTEPGSWKRSDWNWGDLAIERKRTMEREVDGQILLIHLKVDSGGKRVNYDIGILAHFSVQ